MRGYVLRSARNDELYEAIRIVRRGRRYLDPRLSDSITDLLLGRPGAMRRPDVKRLSGRESQVLREIAIDNEQGHCIEIRSECENDTDLSMQESTKNWGLHTRADLVHYPIARGMSATWFKVPIERRGMPVQETA